MSCMQELYVGGRGDVQLHIEERSLCVGASVDEIVLSGEEIQMRIVSTSVEM